MRKLVVVLLIAATPATAAFATALAAHGAVTREDDTQCFGSPPGFRLSEFYALAERHGVPARAFTHGRPTLEALFLHLTGRKLRE